MSMWINSAANALAPYREGANAYVTSTKGPYSKDEKETLGLPPDEQHNNTQASHNSATPESSNTTSAGTAVAEGQTGEVRRVSGNFNAPTETEIEGAKKTKGWRGKWQKLREYQRPDKSS